MMQKLLKDHEFTALVNALRDTAIQFHDTQQLRARISHLVTDALFGQSGATPAQGETFDEFMVAEYSKQYERATFPAGAMRKCWARAQQAKSSFTPAAADSLDADRSTQHTSKE